jgi:hypothetical protein
MSPADASIEACEPGEDGNPAAAALHRDGHFN